MRRRAKEVLILEPSSVGHRMYFAAMLAEALSGRGIRTCLITSPEGKSHPAARRVFDAARGMLTIETTEMPAVRPLEQKLLGDAVEIRLRYGRIARDNFFRAGGPNRFGFVMIPYLDPHLPLLALRKDPFGGTPWSGVTMRTRFHMRRTAMLVPARRYDLLERPLFWRLVNSPFLAALFTLDPYLAEYAGSSRVIYVPDVAEFRGTSSRDEARQSLGIRPDEIVLLVYGLLDARKHIALLLEAIADRRCPEHLVTLLAGDPDAETGQHLAGAEASRLIESGRLKVMSGHVDDFSEQRLFAACDIVWVVYDNHFGSSGVLVKAGQAGKPVISCAEGLIGRLVTDHSLGLRIAAATPSDVVATLTQLSTDSALRRRCGEAGSEVFSRHVPEAFTGPIVGTISAALEPRVSIDKRAAVESLP